MSSRVRHVSPFAVRSSLRPAANRRVGVTGSVAEGSGVPGIDSASFCAAVSTGAIAAVATVLIEYATRPIAPEMPKREKRRKTGARRRDPRRPDALRTLVGTFAVVAASALAVSSLQERSRRADLWRALGAGSC